MPLEIDYHNISVHKLMLRDKIRCESFAKALRELVTPDSVVLDIGAGTGILSIFSAQAGARITYAIERTRTAELAKCIIAENQLSDRIKVFQADMESVELPEQVDLIVSEWLGGYGVDENLLPVVVQARDRWLKPDGIMIPGAVSSWIVPSFDDELEKDVQFWSQQPYGVELSAIGDNVTHQLQCCRNNVKQEHILSDPCLMWEIDAKTISLETATNVFESKTTFVCSRSGLCNSFAAWFEAYLSPDNILSNRPSTDYTHWGRWVFPIGKTIQVEKGSQIDLRFSLRPESIGHSKAIWEGCVGDYPFSCKDMTSLTK